ncbi:hypothetical protein DFH11DRAFT_1749179, partial [Phellopilus nigrolimitatus]
MTRTTRIAVLGLCRTAITSTSATALFRVQYCGAARFSRSPSTSKAFGAARSLPVLGHPQCYTHAYDPDKAAALLDSEGRRAIAKTSLVVDDLLRDLVRARGNFAAEGERAPAKLVEENDRNLLEFLAVLDTTFAAPAVADKVRDVRNLFHQRTNAFWRRDRGALLALLELEKRTASVAKRGLKDFKLYAVLEDAELSVLVAYLEAHTHVSDSEPTLCRPINVLKLRQHILGTEGLSAAQETERALAYLSTLVRNSSELGWLSKFLRIYILVFLLASDVDETVEEKLLFGDRPKVADIPENKSLLKERIHETLRGNNAKGAPKANGSPSPPTNGQKRHAEKPSAVRDPPEAMATRFKEGSGEYRLPREALHVAALTQEAALMLALASVRFKEPAVVKANKFGWLTANLCTLLEKENTDLKEMASALAKTVTYVSTSERRCAFVDRCRYIQ